jgi:hypothetical protein
MGKPPPPRGQKKQPAARGMSIAAQLAEAALQAGPPSRSTPPIAAPMLVGATYPRERAILEIFAGCARLSGACCELGLSICIPVERQTSPLLDISNPVVANTILTWIEAGLIWYVHLATPCCAFSRARTTGKTPSDWSAVVFTQSVLRIVAAKKLLFSLENPAGSGLFSLPALGPLFAELGCVDVFFETCAYGACYRKATQVRTNCRALLPLTRRCADMPKHVHEHLSGTVTILGASGKPGTHWRTALAAKYVPDLCRAWASILRTIAPAAGIVLPGQPMLSRLWSVWLEQATGLVDVNGACVAAPVCPDKFECEWEKAVRVWGPIKRAAAVTMKRPAARARGENAREGTQPSC